MEKNFRRDPTYAKRVFLGLVLATGLGFSPTRAQAGPVALTASDFSLSLYAASGSSWRALGDSELQGTFSRHRCLCPETMMVGLELTTTGMTNLGSSTLKVDFMLGASCSSTSSTGCSSLGQVVFSASASGSAPTFDSGRVFQAALGTSTVDCATYKAGSTALWAVLAQDGVALSFTPGLALPVIATTVSAPTAVTALPSDQGILVSWTPPADTAQVAGYQVLCLPRPATALTAGYESCGLDNNADASTVLTAADQTQVCSGTISAGSHSVRLSGLVNGTAYQVAVIAIDVSGGVSAPSPVAQATPQPTDGFYEKYKQAGGAASGCALSGAANPGWSWLAVVAVLLWLGRRARVARILVLLCGLSAAARAQDWPERATDDWAADAHPSPIVTPPDWGFELGVSWYRPDVDREFGNGVHPYADTFGSSGHLMSEMEVSRYLGHRFGTWGVGLRGGYHKVNGSAFLSDAIARSGDATSLRLIPFAVSALYRADQVPGLKRIPLIPYVKAGLDGVTWTTSRTGGGASHSGFTPGWHVAAGTALGLNFLGMGSLNPGAIADPCALFFEWDYAAINGLGLGGKLHVGDSTWFAGIMFDL